GPGRPAVARPLDRLGRREQPGGVEHRRALDDVDAGVGLDLHQVGLVLDAAAEQGQAPPAVGLDDEERRAPVGVAAGEVERLAVERDQVGEVARGHQRPVAGDDDRAVDRGAPFEPGRPPGVAELVEDEGEERPLRVDDHPVVVELGQQSARGPAEVQRCVHPPTIRAPGRIGAADRRAAVVWRERRRVAAGGRPDGRTRRAEEPPRALALSRRVDQQQRAVVNNLNPGDQSPLETTIGYEQVAVDLTAWLARNEPDPALKQALDFALLEDFDHLYRYANLYELIDGRDAAELTDSLTEIMPGRPTVVEHRHPYDDVRPHYDTHTVDPLSRLHVMTIVAAEQQTMNYYL